MTERRNGDTVPRRARFDALFREHHPAVRAYARNTERDGATHTVEYHEWLSTSPPYNNRLIVIVNGKVLWGQAFLDGRLDLYDPTTDTIYLAPGVASNDVVGCQRCSSDTPQSNSALSEVQDLLNQPNVTINRHAARGVAQPAVAASPASRRDVRSQPHRLQGGTVGAGSRERGADRALT